VTTPDQTTGQFAGQVVIVTGAGSGIGRATAAAFADAGANVLGAGRREDAVVQGAMGRLPHRPGQVLTVDGGLELT
jgi:NADP-dependent 3-hydroxy acid dehydrogenase YdfG